MIRVFAVAVCLIFVICLGLVLYTHYDTQKFIQSLPQPPHVEKTVSEKAADTERTPTESETIETSTDTTDTADSDLSTDFVDSMSIETQRSESDVQIEENSASDDMEVSNVSEPEEERFLGRTLAEIEAELPVLEQEIRTNLTKAVELYADLRKTDGMAGESPEIAAWRDETWAEVKRLFHDVSDTGKILTYISYLRVTGRENPMNPGGWLSDLIEPLPMRVSVDFN